MIRVLDQKIVQVLRMVIDDQLIEGCKHKNRVAQKQLYGILLPFLNAVCRRYANNSFDVNDILQETFINIFSNLEKYDSNRAQFKTWSVKIAINCTLKHNKKMYQLPVKQLEVDLHSKTIEPDILDKLSDEDLLAFLKTMPKKYFDVFNLSAIDGFSHKEIGAILNIEENLSRKRLSRARTWLISKIGNRKIENIGLRKFI